MNDRLLIIPVEIRARELAAKLLVGALAVARGYSVVIGRGGEVASFARYLPPGIFLEKDVAAGRRGQFRTLADRGHALIAWDDEGVVEINYDWYVRYRIDRDNLRAIQNFFAWGLKQADAIRRHFPDLAGKVVETGNPRIDLLRPAFRGLWEAEATGYRKRFGDYILINTNFAGVNIFNKQPENFVKLLSERLSLNADEADIFHASLKFSGLIYDKFRHAVPALSKQFPTTQIVLRPHPSEHHDTWREIARDCPNVHVLYEGTAIGWIAGAKVLIHNGCTTGLEGVIMQGAPVVAYRPHQSELYELRLPNDVSIQAFSEGELLEKVSSIMTTAGSDFGEGDRAEAIIHSHIASLRGPLASERILDVIDQVQPHHDKRRLMQYPIVYLLKRIYIRAFFFWHGIINHLRHGNQDAFRPHLFREEDLREMNQLLAQLADAEPKVRGVVARRIFPFCYRLEKIA